MSTNVLIVLDIRRARTDGTYPLLLRIIHNRTKSEIALGKYFNKKDWDDAERKVKSTYRGTESIQRLNNYIQKRKTEALDLITKLQDTKKINGITHANQIKAMINRGSKTPSFLGYMQELIDKMIEVGKIGNARSYKSVKSVLKSFMGNKDLLFSEVTYQFLERLEETHLKKGNSYNGLAVYLRTIRAVYNKGMKEGLIDKEFYPFANYKIRTVKTRKRAIQINALSAIENLEFEKDDPLYHTRNYFLFCYYMRGLPFVDMAHLQLKNIVGDRIQYEREKTEKPLDIKITGKIQDILLLYTTGKTADDFIFDIVKRTSDVDIYKDIEWARARYNKKLKKIGELCGIAQIMTSYVSRHSFATRAKFLKMPITAISEMLSHSDIKTTQIYLDSLPSDEMDNYHEQIIEDKHNNPRQ